MEKNNKLFDFIAWASIVAVLVAGIYLPMLAIEKSPAEIKTSVIIEEGIMPRDAVKMFDIRDVPIFGEKKNINTIYEMYPCEEKYFSYSVEDIYEKKVIVSIRAICRGLNKTFDSNVEVAVPPKPITWGYENFGYRVSSFSKNENDKWVMEIMYRKTNGVSEFIVSLVAGIFLAILTLGLFVKLEKKLVERDWTCYIKYRLKWKKE